MQTIPQGTLLWAKEPFQFINPDTNRVIKINCAESFWVTNPQIEQKQKQIIKVARSNSKIGWNFTPEDVAKYFKWK